MVTSRVVVQNVGPLLTGSLPNRLVAVAASVGGLFHVQPSSAIAPGVNRRVS